MTKEMKRPTSDITQDSIKPSLSNAVELYTNKQREAHKCIQERDEYINYLESKLSSAKPQQALPVVPEYVAVQIERVKNSNGNFANLGLLDWNHETKPDYTKWIHENVSDFMRACTIGYQVEKPQLFYLKNKLTGLWLMRDEVDKVYPYDHTTYIGHRDKFNQQEIDSMQTGSYELVPVEDEE